MYEFNVSFSEITYYSLLQSRSEGVGANCAIFTTQFPPVINVLAVVLPYSSIILYFYHLYARHFIPYATLSYVPSNPPPNPHFYSIFSSLLYSLFYLSTL